MNSPCQANVVHAKKMLNILYVQVRANLMLVNSFYEFAELKMKFGFCFLGVGKFVHLSHTFSVLFSELTNVHGILKYKSPVDMNFESPSVCLRALISL